MPNTANTQSRKGTTARYVIAGATGGAGRVVDMATAKAVSGVAERAVGAYKRRRRRKGVAEMQEPDKKLDGAGFWVIVGLAATKDIIDVILASTFIFAIIASFMGIAITFIILFYFIYNDVRFTTRKLVTIIVTFIIETIPFIGIIPTATISLFIIKKMENSEHLRKFA